jgi:hypothetical protein
MMEPACWQSLAHEGLSRWLEVQRSGSSWWRRSAPRSSTCTEERAEMGRRGSKMIFRLDEATLRGDKNAGRHTWLCSAKGDGVGAGCVVQW